MIAIIARRPFASSAANFFSFSAGSLEVRTLKPKSPGVPVFQSDDPAESWHLGDGSQAVRNVRKLQSGRAR